MLSYCCLEQFSSPYYIPYLLQCTHYYTQNLHLVLLDCWKNIFKWPSHYSNSGHIQNPGTHLIWSFLRKYLKVFTCLLFSQKALHQIFDRDLNTRLNITIPLNFWTLTKIMWGSQRRTHMHSPNVPPVSVSKLWHPKSHSRKSEN